MEVAVVYGRGTSRGSVVISVGGPTLRVESDSVLGGVKDSHQYKNNRPLISILYHI